MHVSRSIVDLKSGPESDPNTGPSSEYCRGVLPGRRPSVGGWVEGHHYPRGQDNKEWSIRVGEHVMVAPVGKAKQWPK